ncbi:helix-turn-helix transcriptional regulator [Mucilaginibacter rubeus]|uniref:Helix-turn-helix transcriptional regulator n=1 Tax=Mucilaginibacter rubeus TaxID=2027860 RepID=A0AAE6JDF4_9SPHI|nr:MULTISPECIES: helix-turn-helix transcriptional regulator [Mucilaginibacter]QEM03015.1 helix-turn-helix transcriptional regulator [Mucilaginibacter rubeus]QEM15633.1 helix-turn-helix transcriptional regulator [Mucilaginibacter gossypii]QTE39341.1 helix-turn-helix transcriptional regulator [Mucilaginibacter gossypii]QTE41632.1 helix-turn-helix transcriptional regulator [Mucilaginibacter rubeus]QTE48237.1 helix-turn-helix transcriptional regulator [Mucilaginibacter rubeus]
MLTEKLIANRIRAIRQEKNYTQFYVAYKLNVSQNTFSKIELGNVKLTLARLIDIAKVLEVDLHDFLKEEHLHIIAR